MTPAPAALIPETIGIAVLITVLLVGSVSAYGFLSLALPEQNRVAAELDSPR